MVRLLTALGALLTGASALEALSPFGLGRAADGGGIRVFHQQQHEQRLRWAYQPATLEDFRDFDGRAVPRCSRRTR